MNTLWFVPLNALWCHDGNPFNRRFNRAVQTRRDPELVRRVRAHIRSVLPQLTYTALAVVHGVGDHPMLVHTHPKDDSPLTGEIALGDFVGGGLFTSALLCANGPSRPAWIRWGRDLLWRHIVDPRYGVMFNALRPHVPLAWSGQRIVLVPYTGIAWGRLPVAMQNELVTFGFPRKRCVFCVALRATAVEPVKPVQPRACPAVEPPRKPVTF